VWLTTHVHKILSLRMSGPVLQFPCMPSWNMLEYVGKINFFI